MNIFFDRLDASLPYPVIIRLVRTINTMLFLIHIFTCLYFLYSDLEGLDSSSFVYNGYGHAYIRCFYVAMKTQIRDCSYPTLRILRHKCACGTVYRLYTFRFRKS